MSRLHALISAGLLLLAGAVLPVSQIAVFLALNGLGAGVWAFDKVQAQAQRARVPEWTLHLLAGVAGPGAGLARYLCRHKTQKSAFGVSVTLGLAVTAGQLLRA